MSPATSWTEDSTSYQGWADYGESTRRVLLFGGALVMGGHLAPLTPTWTESSVSATSYTEKSVSASTWTEGTL